MKRNIGILIFVAVIVGLFFVSWFLNPDREVQAKWESLGINCLPNGHQNLALHIHPIMEIFINGAKQNIPGNIGILSTCMAELHTHDADGVVHIETIEPTKKFTLGQFLSMAGAPFLREGYEVALTVNQATSTVGESLVMEDMMRIGLYYTAK